MKITSLWSDNNYRSQHHEGTKPSSVIENSRKSFYLGLRDIWEYRMLLYFMIWRDIKVRYKQTIMGASWAVLQPFASMIIFTVVFSMIVKVPSEGFPYPLFIYTALVPWYFFSRTVGECAVSIISNDNLIKKVYFPRIILLLASLSTNIVDFFLSFILLLGLMAWYQIPFTFLALSSIFFLFLTSLIALSIGIWFATLNVKYRDVNHMMPFLLQLWMYLTPNFYPVSLIPEKWQALYRLNPMVGVVEGFRWALLGKKDMDFTFLAINMLLVITVLFGGIIFFNRAEETFADII